MLKKFALVLLAIGLWLSLGGPSVALPPGPNRDTEQLTAEWEAKERALGPDHPEALNALQNLATAYLLAGDHQQHLELNRQLYEVRKRTLGPDNQLTLTALFGMLASSNALGDYKKALEISLQMHETNLRLHGPDHPLTLAHLTSVANAYRSLGNYQGALEVNRQIYENSLRLQGPNHPLTKTSLFGLAGMYYELGDYQQALEIHRPIWEAQERLCPPENWETLETMSKATGSGEENPCGVAARMSLGTLTTLANTYAKLGDYQSAQELIRRAWEADLRFYGGLAGQKQFASQHGQKGDDGLLVYPNQLARLYNASGDYQKALDVYKDAEKPTGQNMAPQYYSNLAEAYRGLGDHRKVLELCQEAEEAFKSIYSPDHPIYLNALHDLAGAYDEAGDQAKALELARQAFIGQIRKMGLNHPDTAKGAARLSAVYDHDQQLGMAVFYARLAVAGAESQRQSQKSLDENLQKSYLAKVESFYQNLSALLIKAGRPEEALEVLRQSKTSELSQLSEETPADAAPSSAATTQAQFKQLSEVLTQADAAWTEQRKKDKARAAPSQEPDITQALQQQSEALANLPPEKLAEIARHLDPAALQGLMRQAGAEAQTGVMSGPPLEEGDAQSRAELEAQLAEAENNFHDFLSQLPTLLTAEAGAGPYQEAGRRNLAELRGLINKMGGGTVIIHTLSTDEALHLFLTTQDDLIVRQSPVGLKEMDKKIAVLQPLLRSPGLDPRPAAQVIYQALLEPLKAELAGINTIMFSVDGAMRYIPLAALYDGEKWLPENYAVVMFTEAARDQLSSQTKFEVQAAALGLTEAKDGLAALPAVEGELNNVVRQTEGEAGVLPGVKYLNEQFNYDALSENLRAGREVLHLASHFVFRPQMPNMSYLLLGDGRKLTIMEITQDDQLPFDQVDMLTLSACETAAGLARGTGQEIEGLAALAQRRGAATILATLWPIADESTGQLMSDFYRFRFGDKLNKAEALRQAQLSMLRGGALDSTGQSQTRGKIKVAPVSSLMKADQTAAARPWTAEAHTHPYFWAPFIIMGSWK